MDEYLRNQLSVSDQWRERAEAGPRPAERIALGETPTPDRQQPSRGLADHDLNEHIIIGVLRREPVIGFIRSREVGLADRPWAVSYERRGGSFRCGAAVGAFRASSASDCSSASMLASSTGRWAEIEAELGRVFTALDVG